jgi:dipeptidase E
VAHSLFSDAKIRINLSSSFKDVADLFRDFAQEDVKGKTITFIPAASIPKKIKFYAGSAKKAFVKTGIVVDELDPFSALAGG